MRELVGECGGHALGLELELAGPEKLEVDMKDEATSESLAGGKIRMLTVFATVKPKA